MSEGEIQGKEQNELTEQQKRAKDLFFQSFRFSQGSLTLQHDLLNWLVTKGYFDTIEVREKAPSYIRHIIAPKKHIPLDAAQSREYEHLWRDLYRFKHESQPHSEKELLDTILKNMIERDENYQEVGRPNRKPLEQVVPDSSDGPHASFVRKYIINAHPTGNNAFDELHRKFAPMLTKYRDSPPADRPKDLSVLTKLWEINHPGHTFFPPKE